MREIIHIQIGKAGNAAGTKFWEAICQEHGVNSYGFYVGSSKHQLEKINVYFDRNKKNQYRPRSIIVDLDREPIDNVNCTRYGRIFRAGNLISGSGSTGNNWARGYYTEGRTLSATVLDSARREAERCDCLQGFQMVHSIAGGTGSGLGSLLLQKLSEEYPNRYLSTYTIVHSPNATEDRLQTYNAAIGLEHLTEKYMETYLMDNKALEFLCENSLGLPIAGYEPMNDLISTAMAAITTTTRLPGRLNEGLGRSSINMIPFPRLHYLATGFTPIVSEASDRTPNIPELASELLNPENVFIHPPSKGKYMTASYVFRGEIPEAEVRNYTSHMFQKNCHRFVDWLPDNIKIAVCPVRLKNLKTAAAVIGNTTAMRVVFKRILDMLNAIHEKRSYIHWFTDEGMSSDELDSAAENLHELVNEYKKCEEALYDDVWHKVGVDWGGQL